MDLWNIKFLKEIKKLICIFNISFQIFIEVYLKEILKIDQII